MMEELSGRGIHLCHGAKVHRNDAVSLSEEEVLSWKFFLATFLAVLAQSLLFASVVGIHRE